MENEKSEEYDVEPYLDAFSFFKNNKLIIQQQMRDKEILRQESKKEYEKDRKDIENLINNIKKEDQLAKEELNRKRNIARSYMENTYAYKAEQKRKWKIYLGIW